jgi:hypothetical protein
MRLGRVRRIDVVRQQSSEARRGHAFLGQELPVKIGEIVEADLEADVGDGSLLVAHQYLTSEIDTQPLNVLHQ